MFGARAYELKTLNDLYLSNKFECVVLHGRLRVGKTALLREFMKNKDCIYFAAGETGERDNLASLVSAVESFPRVIPGEPKLKHYFEEVFERLNKLSRTERVVIIIDNYDFLVSSSKNFSDLLSRHIDSRLSTGQLMIVLCGSSNVVMHRETLDYGCSFHGHRTAQLELKPLTFFEAKRLYTGFSAYDIAVVYAITGGIPKYLNIMNPDLSIEDNILSNFFDESSPMFEEPSNFLRREVRDLAYYNTILKAIAFGHNRNSEIASLVGLETSACTAYLRNLTSFGLVDKHTPITEKAGKKTIYEIKDSMFRFWYRYVPDNLSLIQSKTIDQIWRSVAQDIPVFMKKVFEDICRQWVEQRNNAGKFDVRFAEVGRWWGYDLVTRGDTYIPIVAYFDDEHALFADAVWSEEPTEASVLRSLEERSRLFRFPNRHLYLFSRSGFTEECGELAARFGANLILFE